MKIKIIIATALLCSLNFLNAEDIKLKNGEKHINIFILKETEKSLFVYATYDTLTILKKDIAEITYTEYDPSKPSELIYEEPSEDLAIEEKSLEIVTGNILEHGNDYNDIVQDEKNRTIDSLSDTPTFGISITTAGSEVPMFGLSIGVENKMGLIYHFGLKTNFNFIGNANVYEDVSYYSAINYYGDIEKSTRTALNEVFGGIDIPIIKKVFYLSAGLSLQIKTIAAELFDSDYSTTGSSYYEAFKERTLGFGIQVGGMLRFKTAGFSYKYSVGLYSSHIFGINFFLK